jgi:alpha-tubulin suppressor-like RCC1 family protein
VHDRDGDVHREQVVTALRRLVIGRRAHVPFVCRYPVILESINRQGGSGMTARRVSARAPRLALVLVFFGVAAATASGAVRAGATHATLVTTKVRLAGGVYHSVAVTSSGAVFAWGWNIVGQLGNGSTNGSDVPMKVRLPRGTKVTGIAAGFAHTLAVTSTGAVLAWGKNYNSDLANGSTTDSAVPVRPILPAGTKVTAVAAGTDDSLALTSTGAVLAWGLNDYGQLGNGSTGNNVAPVNATLPAGTKVTAIAAGARHTLALTSTGSVLAWGYNADGELGDGNRTSSNVPVDVKLPPGTKVTAVAAGGYYSLALTSTGAVYAWGYNADGELGNGGKSGSDVPVEVRLPHGTKVTAIAAGGNLSEVGQVGAGPGHSLALTSTGAVLAWGYNADGELGNGSTRNSDVPVKVKVPAGKKVAAVGAGELQSLAMTSAGGMLAWGGNGFGQLGDGSYAGSDVPMPVKQL